MGGKARCFATMVEQVFIHFKQPIPAVQGKLIVLWSSPVLKERDKLQNEAGMGHTA
jgi:hypothetical protein